MKKIYIKIDGMHCTNCENTIRTSLLKISNISSVEFDGFIAYVDYIGKIRISFNTCQACNPSPNAYFIQIGEYLQCQNCRNKFHINKIGIEKGGCNPAPVEEKEETDNSIIIDQEYADSYKAKFENWKGLIK